MLDSLDHKPAGVLTSLSTFDQQSSHHLPQNSAPGVGRCDGDVGYCHEIRLAAGDGQLISVPTARADQLIAVERANARIHRTVRRFIVFQVTFVGWEVPAKTAVHRPVKLHTLMFNRVSELDTV